MNWHAWAVGAVILGIAWTSSAADLMTFSEISMRVRMGESPQTIVQEAGRRKLVEPLTGEQEEALQKAGVSSEWIAALRAPDLIAAPGMAAAYNQRKGIPQQVLAAHETPTPAPVDAGTKPDSDLIKVGDIAPDFAARAVGDKNVSLHPLKGRVILLVIFATWSPPCLQELKAIDQLVWSKFQADGLAVIALGSGDNLQQLIDFKQKTHFTFDFAEDPQKTINALYATDLIPRCYVVDKEGLVKFTSVGLSKRDFIRMFNIISSEMRR